jgi:hypothetical protein
VSAVGMRAVRLTVAGVLVSAAVGLGACGSKDDGGAITPSNNSPTTAAPGGPPSTASGSPYP